VIDFSAANHLWFEMDADVSCGAELLSAVQPPKQPPTPTNPAPTGACQSTRRKTRGSGEQHALWEHYEERYVERVRARKQAIGARLPFVTFHNREDVLWNLVRQLPRSNFAHAFHGHHRAQADAQPPSTAAAPPACASDSPRVARCPSLDAPSHHFRQPPATATTPGARVTHVLGADLRELRDLLSTRSSGLQRLRELGFRALPHARLPALQHVTSRLMPPCLALSQPKLSSVLHNGGVMDTESGRLVALGLARLPEYGAAASALPQLDWARPVHVSEKTDGTSVLLYAHGGEWLVSLATDPFGEASLSAVDPLYRKKNKKNSAQATQRPKSDPALSVAARFWSLWAQLDYRLPGSCTMDAQPIESVQSCATATPPPVSTSSMGVSGVPPQAPLHHNRCYMFDMGVREFRYTSEELRDRITLFAIRDMCTLRECDPEPVASAHGWECVRSPFARAVDSVEDVASLVDQRWPWKHRGVVLRDHRFGRISVESYSYSLLMLSWFEGIQHGAVPNLSLAESAGDLQLFRMVCG
jgi:hypothetical protein